MITLVVEDHVCPQRRNTVVVDQSPTRLQSQLLRPRSSRRCTRRRCSWSRCRSPSPPCSPASPAPPRDPPLHTLSWQTRGFQPPQCQEDSPRLWVGRRFVVLFEMYTKYIVVFATMQVAWCWRRRRSGVNCCACQSCTQSFAC